MLIFFKATINRTHVLLWSAMDYLVGFLCGYLVKEVIVLLKKLSDWDYDNRQGYYFDLEPLTEDDLP